VHTAAGCAGGIRHAGGVGEGRRRDTAGIRGLDCAVQDMGGGTTLALSHSLSLSLSLSLACSLALSRSLSLSLPGLSGMVRVSDVPHERIVTHLHTFHAVVDAGCRDAPP